MWNFNNLATALLTKRFVGPGTFQVGLELYEVAGPAGLYLIKLKLGHCPCVFIYVSSTTKFMKLTMHMSHIPQCTIQNRNVLISVLNGALWDIRQVHCRICEIGLFPSVASVVRGQLFDCNIKSTKTKTQQKTTMREPRGYSGSALSLTLIISTFTYTSLATLYQHQTPFNT